MSRSLIWISAALFLWGLGESMFYMFQPFFLSDLGADPLTIGYILGAAGVATTIGHIPAGYLADRFGRRGLLIAAWITGVIATWIMALASTLPVFVSGLLLYGLTIFVTSPLNSYITAARGSWTVGRALTLISAFFNLGMVLGPFIGGWIAQHFGLHRVFFVSGIIFIISTFLILMIAPQPREQLEPGTSLTGLFTNGRYLGFLGLGFIVFLAMYFPQPFSVKFLQDVRGLSIEQVGLMGTIGGVGNTLLTYLAGSLDARRGFILGQAGAALFCLMLWQMSGLGWIAVAYFIFGGYRVSRSLYTALIRPLVHESQMGLAYGIAETVFGLMSILAPILAGLLYQQNKTLIYPLAFTGILIGCFLSLNFAPHPARLQPAPGINIIESERP